MPRTGSQEDISSGQVLNELGLMRLELTQVVNRLTSVEAKLDERDKAELARLQAELDEARKVRDEKSTYASRVVIGAFVTLLIALLIYLIGVALPLKRAMEQRAPTGTQDQSTILAGTRRN